MRLFLSLACSFLFIINAFAEDCTFQAHSQKSIITWTSYKTKKKVGVSGTFDDVQWSSFRSKNIKALLSSASFNINTASVESKNASRDNKIASFFFSTMKNGPFIKGQVINLSDKEASVSLTMNGVSKLVLMNYKITGQMLEVRGNIDILDFSMQKQLSALAKACQSRHKGKTWSTMDFKASISIQKTCS